MDDASDRPEASPTEQAPDMARRCYDKGCAATDVVSCNFVDRHGRRCLSTWCAAHRLNDGGQAFCRRHAGVVRALGTTENRAVLPELENRAPSLVDWVATGIDGAVQQLLEGMAEGRDAEELAIEPVHLVIGARGRRWGRSWSVRNKEGHDTLRVSIEVDEHSDPEITARVDGSVVARAIPPWIGHRLRGQWVTPEVDSEERDGFYAQLIALITEAIREADHRDEPEL